MFGIGDGTCVSAASISESGGVFMSTMRSGLGGVYGSDILVIAAVFHSPMGSPEPQSVFWPHPLCSTANTCGEDTRLTASLSNDVV